MARAPRRRARPAPAVPVPVAVIPAPAAPNYVRWGAYSILGMAGVVALGTLIGVGCNYVLKSGNDDKLPKPVVEQLAPTYFSRNALENRVNFGFNDKDSAYIIEIQNFENDGRISPLELKAAATYERRRRVQNPTNAWTREELDCLLQGESEWVSLKEDQRKDTSFSRWYIEQFTPKYDALKDKEGVKVK